MGRPTTYLKYVVGSSKHLAGGSVGGVWRTGWVLVAAGRLIWVLVGGDAPEAGRVIHQHL